MMKSVKKIVRRFFVCTAAVAYVYLGARSIGSDIRTASIDFFAPPDIVLTNNQIAVPGAVTSVAFVRGTAMEAAAEIFASTEEDPTLDEFLTMFFCNACSRHCLLLTPRCAAGRMRNNQAVEIYRAMFPHMEVLR